ncbi:MAG: hypothetical protein ACTH4U_11140 [Pseudoalteromonas prydzensis]|uniref:hypothetical protein n=1 Tax=Pseudoalteromonas prydzensis TaxID=182141 RepID=UPI003F955C4F
MDLIKGSNLIIVTTLILVGCSTSTPPSKAFDNNSDADTGHKGKGNVTKVQFLDVLQFTNVEEIKEETASTIPMNGLYTRLKILPIYSKNDCNNDNCASTPYPYSQRSGFARFFINKKVSINANIIFSAGNYKSTIPLTTIENISTWSEGNSWLRSLTYSNTHEPLFLVPNGTTSASTTFRLQSVEENAPQSSAILGLAVNAIDLVAPTAGILTSINQNDFKAKAAAIDSTLKGVFSKDLKEDVTFSINLANWSDERKYYAQLELPLEGEGWDSPKRGIIGKWEIAAEAPKPSIFYDIHICPDGKKLGLICEPNTDKAVSAVFTRFKAAPKYAEVLGKPLGAKDTDEFTSVKSIVIQLPEVSKLQSSEYIKSLDQEKLTNINAACAAIANKMHTIGLSQFDSQLVIWSTLNGIPSIPLISSELIKNKDKLKACKITINNLS